MPKQQILIPNLNEIMEEFVETTEETVVKQAATVVAKEVLAQNVEPKVDNEEGRKRKRVEEEEK